MKIKKCCICKNPIEIKRTPEGKIYWKDGNNAKPLKKGRCCDICNMLVIIERLKRIT